MGEYGFFTKAQRVISESLTWLESNSAVFNCQKPGYLEFHLVCMADHLRHYNDVALNYPSLFEIVAHTSELEFALASAPAAQ